MNTRATKQHQMLGRILVFGSTHAASFSLVALWAELVEQLRGIVAGLDAARDDQAASGVLEKESLAKRFRYFLQNVVRTAQAIEQDVSGFARRFHMPRNLSLTALLTAGAGMISELKRLGTERFVALGLPQDFLQKLEQDHASLLAMQNSSVSDHGRTTRSTAAIRRLLRTGMKLAAKLNVIAYNTYPLDSDDLREWQVLRHVEKTPSHATQQKPEPAPGSNGPPVSG